MNKITVFGNVGRDAEVRYTKGGTAYAKFSIASNNYAGKDREPTTTWFNATIFGDRATKLAPSITKGIRLLIFGRLEIQEYEAKDGTKRLSPDIIVEDFSFAGDKRERQVVEDVSFGDSNDDDDGDDLF